MLEFSCHTWAFTDLTLPEALGTIARLGFRYADIGSGANFNAARAADSPRKAALEIRADLDLFNLRVGDLYLMLPRISLADEAKRGRVPGRHRAGAARRQRRGHSAAGASVSVSVVGLVSAFPLAAGLS